MSLFSKKCPYCKGTNLYIRRTSPMLVLGCKDCDRKVKLLKSKGLSDTEIKEIITN